ncbi:two-component system sensor histidine kinase NtrB [Persephonella sp.]
MMDVLLFSWILLLTAVYLLNKNLEKDLFLYLSIIPLFLASIADIFSLPFDPKDFLYIIFLLSIFLQFNYEKPLKFKIPFVTWFLFLGTLALASSIYQNEYILLMTPLAFFSLAFRNYKNPLDFVIWILILLSNGLLFIFLKSFFYYGNILFAIYILINKIMEYQQKTEQEKKDYRELVDRAIQSEIQKQYLELDDELKITYKKLKEIFKLSNYSILPTQLEDIAERVVEGLHNLGYSGVIIYIEDSDREIFKKSGFFPNIKRFMENKFQDLDKIYISDDEKSIILPLMSDKGKIGILGVYKKEKIFSKEIEYLSTYGNSVAISIAKTLYFKKINKLQELLSKTFESVDIGIAIVDKDFQVETVNTALEKIVGHKVTGNLFENIPEIQPLRREIKDVIEKKKPLDTIFSSINKKGFIYRIKALPLASTPEEKENIEKLVITIEDVTEKEKLEAQLLQTEKHAVIGKLAAGLSHDIKNPLTAISAYAYTVKKKGEKLKDRTLINLGEKIESNSKRAEDIINKLLNYAKPSYYKERKVNLKEILKTSIDFSLPASKRKNIKINKRLEENIFVYGDPSSLQQVFINLIINAAEAMDYDGNVWITLRKNGNKAMIKIKDNGEGIPESIKDEIFDPFFTTKEKGTGLGLSVVNRIVKDHRGEIYFESVEGEGTEFIVKLPLAED